jgi:hypothetical protein
MAVTNAGVDASTDGGVLLGVIDIHKALFHGAVLEPPDWTIRESCFDASREALGVGLAGTMSSLRLSHWGRRRGGDGPRGNCRRAEARCG